MILARIHILVPTVWCEDELTHLEANGYQCADPECICHEQQDFCGETCTKVRAVRETTFTSQPDGNENPTGLE
jgi:hypothetical protein